MTETPTRTYDTLPIAAEYRRIPLSELVPYPGNARRGNIPLIADSLARYGPALRP